MRTASRFVVRRPSFSVNASSNGTARSEIAACAPEGPASWFGPWLWRL